MARHALKNSFFLSVCILLSASGALYAQSSQPAPDAQSSDRETLTPGVYTGRDTVTLDTSEQRTPSERPNVGDFLLSTRRHIGFSLGIFETYTPDVFISTSGKKAATS